MLVQAHLPGSDQALIDFSDTIPHIGQMFGFADIDLYIIRAFVFSDDHPVVNLHAGFNKENPALLGIF